VTPRREPAASAGTDVLSRLVGGNAANLRTAQRPAGAGAPKKNLNSMPAFANEIRVFRATKLPDSLS
jgi:hypothetical protein